MIGSLVVWYHMIARQLGDRGIEYQYGDAARFLA